MKCQIPICEDEVQGNGHTIGLGDGVHKITICDKCQEKRKDYSPDYETVEEGGKEKEIFVWVWKKVAYASFVDAVNCPKCKQEIRLENMWYDECRRTICLNCGLHFDTEFLKPVNLHETNIWDGKGGIKQVKPGSKVDLLPYNPENPKGEKGKYSSESNMQMKGWLGEGPWVISWIGIWPCGRVMLYVKTATSPGSGAYASDFMLVE